MSVSGDQLFAMGHSSGNETLWCLNALTGEVIWAHEYPCQLIDNLHEGGPCSTPTVDGDRVYSLGKEGQLFCLSKADGKVIWKQELQQLLGVKLPEWGFSSSGLILGDRLILEAGRVVAFNKMTGEVVWQTDIHEAGYGSVAVFEKDGQQLLASLDCDGLRILTATDGKEIGYFEWKSPYRTNSTTPIILDEGIFISTGYNIGCALLQLEGSGLTPIYRNKNMKNHFNNSVLSGGYLYGFDGDSHNGRTVTLNCIDARTGEVRWKQRGLGCGSLLIADSRLVILSESGDLILADAKPDEYKELARSPLLEGRCWTVPCISGGRLYARNAAGLLKCVSLPRGND
ncbi:MAG: PQQ-like beta-propeller repeat protein [Planctomyces sp.]|nr:PQQ-like beta-propeller repeat protein [Planctomyces sp.]